MFRRSLVLLQPLRAEVAAVVSSSPLSSILPLPMSSAPLPSVPQFLVVPPVSSYLDPVPPPLQIVVSPINLLDAHQRASMRMVQAAMLTHPVPVLQALQSTADLSTGSGLSGERGDSPPPLLPPVTGGRTGGSSGGGGEHSSSQSNYNRVLMGMGITSLALLVAIKKKMENEQAADPVVPKSRLSDLLGVSSSMAETMSLGEDTPRQLTCSSRLRDSDASRIEGIRARQGTIKSGLESLLSGSQPNQILVQFAGSGNTAATDFGALETNPPPVKIAEGVRVGKLKGSDQIVVSVDGPGTSGSMFAGPMGIHPTPTGMAACANEVVRMLQSMRTGGAKPLEVNVETFSRGGSAGAIFTQLAEENLGLTIGRMVMFDPEQGPNVRKCDGDVRKCESLDVVRSGANEYILGMMPSTELTTSDRTKRTEHAVLTSHGGSKLCAGDMAEFHRMMMDPDSNISQHLKERAMEINTNKVETYRQGQETLRMFELDSPQISPGESFGFFAALGGRERWQYAVAAFNALSAERPQTVVALSTPQYTSPTNSL